MRTEKLVEVTQWTLVCAEIFFFFLSIYTTVWYLCQYLCAIPANSWHNKTWPSSTKLRGLHREADWNEDWRTHGGVTRPWSLPWTCGRVCWSITTRLDRQTEMKNYQNCSVVPASLLTCAGRTDSQKSARSRCRPRFQHTPRASLCTETASADPATEQLQFIIIIITKILYSGLILLARGQEGHLDCKKSHCSSPKSLLTQ